ncbi:FAD-binding protein [Modestobacter sp. L9-4]|uniref:D-arabinono-1,4-lactone oxidase n=1 Tax=Modestobacter sp. L9-4 TaxID=2851567 RepID=UPI001C7544F8|nr:D-arabinono-1,4-lactone oxidase [Modestobacter sp. L9-4]QXG76218.1 FAD-binding protein [Modestobacter sp. L9-4]
MTELAVQWAGINWAGNYRYGATALHRPASLTELQEVVARTPQLHVLGSRHSFNGVADSAELVSLEDMTDAASLVVSPDRRTVTVDAGLKYGEITEALHREGLALHNLASLPHISVAGAVATATHGSGVGNRNLAGAVAGLELVTSDGELVRVARGDADFAGMVVGMGALGVLTRVTLDVEPEFSVAQRVFDHLPWDALFENFEEIVSSAYSVSLFTLFGGDVDMVWTKSRTDGPAVPEEMFGARPADGERHPIPGIDPTPATPQLGVAGLWSDRLPHFRMGFTPSNGDEIQTEYLLPRSQAVAGLQALLRLGPAIRPLLQTCEIRTIAADDLWMSTAQGQDSVAFHFTWVQDQPAVEHLLVDLEGALLPLGARPHWGKVFLADAATLAPRYDHHGDFVSLVQRMDPRGAFRTAWLERNVLG